MAGATGVAGGQTGDVAQSKSVGHSTLKENGISERA